MRLFTEQFKSYAFTMAEILISLTIIGVIAAITIPSLIGNINEKTFTTKRKALYSRISQAIALMPNLNGFGEYEGTWNNNSVTASKDTTAASFITNGLSKVLELENICTVDMNATADAARAELKKCGIPTQYTKWEASEKTNFPTKLSEFDVNFVDHSIFPSYDLVYQNPQKNVDTRVGAFTTKNGESVAVIYNPQCVSKDVIYPEVTAGGNVSGRSIRPYLCASFIFDLNGLKGPNKIGKDMWFMSAIYSTNSDILMIEPKKIGLDLGATRFTYDNAVSYCASNNSRLPRKEEGLLLLYNWQFSGVDPRFWIQGTSAKGSNYARGLYTSAGCIMDALKTSGRFFRCIKR